MTVLFMPPGLSIYQGRRQFIPGAQVLEADIPEPQRKAVKDWNALVDAAVKTGEVTQDAAVLMSADDLKAVIDKAKAAPKTKAQD